MRSLARTVLLRRLPPVEEEREVWRPIAGYEGFYEVSDQGRVRSLERDVALTHRYGGAVEHHRAALDLIPSPELNGRLRVDLSREGRRRTIGVAKLVLEAFVGKAPPGHYAAHGDGDKGHCALANLAWRPRWRTARRGPA